MGGDDKRRRGRIQPYVAPCSLALDGRICTGYVTDLSPEGAQVALDVTPPPEGSRVGLEIRFRQAAAGVRLAAEVRWIRPQSAGYVLGLSFTGVAAHHQAVLDTIVEQFKRKAEQL